ncbi:MAG: hypothetical protein IIW43_06700, partial [Selenomonadales bacterium]|nr:hypothetical protein [Selenomonadales bacterium]
GFYEKTPYVSDGHFHKSYEAVQLTVVNGTTITPGTTTKTAVSSGNKYIKGNIRVAGSSYLKAFNIKKGIAIFGVYGNYDPVADLPRYNGEVADV